MSKLPPVEHGPFRVVFREGLTASIEYRPMVGPIESITVMREELPQLEATLHEASLLSLMSEAFAKIIEGGKKDATP